MALFDVARAHKLTCQQRVEKPAEIDPEIVLNKLRVELCVMRDLDRPRRCEQTAQRSQRIAVRDVAVAEVIEVEDVNAVRSRELDQS
jgi:hypothetical protein